MKNVLLPTDLTVQSMSPVHNIVRDCKNEKVIIHAVHMLSLPTSITELLFLEENKPYSKIPLNFIEACQMLHNKYKKSIEKIEFGFLYCSSARYFNNYVEGNGIEKVYMLENYRYKQPLQQSEKFTNFIQRCKVPLVNLPLHLDVSSEYQILSSLLDNNVKEALTSNSRAKTEMTYS